VLVFHEVRAKDHPGFQILRKEGGTRGEGDRVLAHAKIGYFDFPVSVVIENGGGPDLEFHRANVAGDQDGQVVVEAGMRLEFSDLAGLIAAKSKATLKSAPRSLGKLLGRSPCSVMSKS